VPALGALAGRLRAGRVTRAAWRWRGLALSAGVHGGMLLAGLALFDGLRGPEPPTRFDASLAMLEPPPDVVPEEPEPPFEELEEPEVPEPMLEEVPYEALPDVPEPEPELDPVQDLEAAWSRVPRRRLRRIERPVEPPPEPAPVVVEAAAPTPDPEPPREPVRVEAAIVHAPPPPYPNVSARIGEEGTVQLELDVAANGRVTDARVVKSSGFARLDRAALEAVRKWRLRPATVDGRAVAGTLLHEIVFRLDG